MILGGGERKDWVRILDRVTRKLGSHTQKNMMYKSIISWWWQGPRHNRVDGWDRKVKGVTGHKMFKKLRPNEHFSHQPHGRTWNREVHCGSVARILIDGIEKDRVESDGADIVCLRTEFVWIYFALFFIRE